MRRALFAAAVCSLIAASPASAQQTDIIRGRITGQDSVPLQGVNVRAISYLGSIEKTTATDKSGRFTLIFINGEGDYWIELIKIGFKPKRYEIKKIGDEEVLIADAQMSDVATVDKVDVVAQRNRGLPSRAANSPDVGGGDKPLNTNGVPPDQAGNLAAMAATVAGIQLIPGLDGASDMFSMLGLTGDQNNTTFDGLGSGVTALPPDILATTSIKPYPFDVSFGGFSGAQIAIQTLPGSNFSRRSLNNVNIAPPLEWPDQSAIAQGQRFTDARLGGNAAGPIALNQAFYNTAYNIQRHFTSLQTLLNTGAIGLTAAGVAPDSAERLLGILRQHGIPVSTSGLPRLQLRDAAQLTANVDLIPSASGTGNSFTLGAAGSYQKTEPASRGGLLLTTPAHAGQTTNWGANLVAVHTNYFWFGVLSKTTLGLAGFGTSTSPYEQLSEGSVRVASSLPDGGSSVKSLLFGGSSIESSVANQAIQLNNQLSWYSINNAHTLKLTSSLMRDAFRSENSPGLLGTFTYNSLADLESARPASFTRTLGTVTTTGSQIAAAASFGDYWRPSQGLQVQFGVRADANRFLGRPAFNQNILNAFGSDNSSVPNRVYLSPRIGMQWFYGNSPQVAFAPGAARPPRAVIHLGAGVFQNVAPAQLIGGAMAATGLPSSTQSITCVGQATPFPAWDAFLTSASAIPTRCADGSSGSVFATAAPSVALFDRAFRQQKSLRAAGDWSGPILDNRFVLGVQSIVSTGLNQAGTVDINLNRAPRFTLSNEGGRPVFVDPSAIVQSTGAVSLVGSRVSPAFQHVWEQRSDLRLESKQLSINLKPVTANAYLRWDATYTLLDTRETFTGFTSTAGNPFDVQSGAVQQPGRHTLALSWYDFPIADLVYITAAVRLMSGGPYTPTIAGDVNGDGVMNDRAFIADPSKIADAAQAASMRSLLANAPSAVRGCLERQLGSVAGRGSCRAPWVSQVGLTAKFNPQKIGLPKRTTITLQLQNPLALADLALHGNTDLRGWGQASPPDRNLLFVRGFDPVTRTFKYDVNQRFGSTRPQESATHAVPYMSLGVSVDIGMSRERQLLTQRLDMGRARPGSRARADAMTLFGVSSIPNPMYLILQQSDSLRLTREQADSLAELSRAFAVYADSVWTPAGRYLASLSEVYSTREAYDRYVTARERTVDFLLTLVPDAKRVLTASQRRQLPRQVANFLDERVLRFLRSSSSGDGSSVVIR